MRILREEVIPVFERLGEVREKAVTQARIATILLGRGQPGDRNEAKQLLAEARAAAERLRIPEVNQIRARSRTSLGYIDF